MIDTYPSRCAVQPELLSRVDPVAYAEWRPEAPLIAEQIVQFDRDGYLVLENVFGEDEVAALQTETRRLLADPSDLDDETVITESASREIRSIFAIHQQSSVMTRLAADKRLVDVARFLLDDEVYLHQSRLNYKPGFQGKEFYWHSD